MVRAGGTAYLLKLAGEEGRAFQVMFDRSAEYARLMEAIQGFRVRLGEYGAAEAKRALRQLRRDFEAISAIDYFPGPAASRWSRHCQKQRRCRRADRSGRAAAGGERDRADGYQRLRARIWATRRMGGSGRKRLADPAVHRSRSAVLMAQSPRDCPADAIGFDFDGAAFTHIGARVTFEVLLASFGLDSDPALARLGALVHYLDVGGVPVAEAAGLGRCCPRRERAVRTITRFLQRQLACLICFIRLIRKKRGVDHDVCTDRNG